MAKSSTVWTEQQYADYLKRQNLNSQGVRKDAVLEPASKSGALGEVKAEERTTERFLIQFTSVRKRLCDEDNLSEKWLCDCLRYCHAIRGDEPDKAKIQTGQRKCEKGEDEHTLIEIYKLPD